MSKMPYLVVTALLLLLLAAPVSAFSGAGSGTSADPYRITNADQFLEMRIDSGYFVLENDIDLTGKYWSSLVERGASDKPLHLDGQGHIVKNLYVSGNGMFSITGSDFSIRNVVFESPTLRGSAANDVTAGLITDNLGYVITLENVGIVNADFKATVAVSGKAYLGGFFGSCKSPSLISPIIKNCFVTGTLTAQATSTSYVGGIYAYRQSGGYPTISYCYTKITSDANYVYGIGPTGTDTCYYEESVAGGGGGIGVTLAQMQNPTTFVDWNIYGEPPWVMSRPDSSLLGMPCFNFMDNYRRDPVYPIMNLTITGDETNYVGVPILIKWSDDEPKSDASDYILTIKNPNGEVVYTNYAKAGSYTLTPDIPGVWRIDYNSSMGSTYGLVSVLPAQTDLRLTITPKTAYLYVTEVTVTWDDVSPHSPGTNYYLQIIGDDIVYESSSKSGTYTFTPDRTGAYLVKYGCDQDEVTDQITVLPPYLTANVDITGSKVGDPLTITWSFDHLGVIPDTGRKITRYEFDVYEYTSLDPLESHIVETIKTSEISGTLEKVYPTAKTFPATSTYYAIQPYVIDDRNQRYGDIPGDYVEVSIYEPFIAGYSPSEYYTDAETLSIEIDRGSFPAMTGTERINVTVGLRDKETEEWVFTSKTYSLPDGETTFTLDTTTLPESPYDRLVKIAYETVQGNSVTSRAEKEWLLKAPPVYPTVSWKNPETGKPVTSVNKNQPVALYFTPGARWSGDDEYLFFKVYAYRYNPVLDRYEPYLYNGTEAPIMTGNWTSMLFGDDMAMAETLTFPETGTYKVCVFRLSYPDMVLQTPPIAESDPLKVTENWFSPDTGANEAGKIFGLDGDAIKLVIGMLIVIGCAAVPPLVFGNSHPMVVLIGGVAGLIIGYALTLIPFWILLLLAIVAIAMVILNVRGGSTPSGGDE